MGDSVILSFLIPIQIQSKADSKAEPSRNPVWMQTDFILNPYGESILNWISNIINIIQKIYVTQIPTKNQIYKVQTNVGFLAVWLVSTVTQPHCAVEWAFDSYLSSKKKYLWNKFYQC